MKKTSSPRGRPSKGIAAKVITLQVRVDARVDNHVKANGGSAFVRDLIVKSMKKPSTAKPAIKQGPKPQAVKDAMGTLPSKTAPRKTKELAGETANFRKDAIKEGAKATPAPAKKPAAAKKPEPKPTPPKPAAKPKAASAKKK